MRVAGSRSSGFIILSNITVISILVIVLLESINVCPVLCPPNLIKQSTAFHDRVTEK